MRFAPADAIFDIAVPATQIMTILPLLPPGAAVLMQNSGLGNALNAFGSFAIPYGIGVPLVLSMRGTLGEANPSQVPMGRATPDISMLS